MILEYNWLKNGYAEKKMKLSLVVISPHQNFKDQTISFIIVLKLSTSQLAKN